MTAAPSARATQAGILLMIGASLTFGAQDGLSRLLAESYGPVTVIAIRFWFSRCSFWPSPRHGRAGSAALRKANGLSSRRFAGCC